MNLNVINISKKYKDQIALSGFSVTLSPGIYALLGPNGSGKSTLMNILTDNLKSDSGEVLYTDENGMTENILNMEARFREKLGYMPQYPGMYTNFTVSSYLWYMATLKNLGKGLHGKTKKEFIRLEITRVLHEVELEGCMQQYIGTLSGGMKQRLALAQAVLGDPEIVILDEPTAGLDPKQRIAIRNFLSRIASRKIIIIATHVVSDVDTIAKEIILLKKGVIVDSASPVEMIRKMDGKVWILTINVERLREYQDKYRVVQISNDSITGKMDVRIISEEIPDGCAKQAIPTLEDYYLYMFGEETSEVESHKGTFGIDQNAGYGDK